MILPVEAPSVLRDRRVLSRLLAHKPAEAGPESIRDDGVEKESGNEYDVEPESRTHT